MSNEKIVEQIRSGSEKAKTDLCIRNRGIIAKFANSLKGYAEFDDLMQEGYIALLTAAEKYDAGRGVPFVNYAAGWIRAGMTHYIRDNGNTIRIPAYMREQIRAYNAAVQCWKREHGARPSDLQLCRVLGVSFDALDGIRAAALVLDPVSMEAETADGLTIADAVTDPCDRIEEATEHLQAEQRAAAVWGEVATLPEQQAATIRARYQDNLTLKAAGDRFGVTLETVRQLEQKALRELRKPKHKKKLQPYYEDIRGAALRDTGLSAFMRTRTSATEKTALKLMGAWYE